MVGGHEEACIRSLTAGCFVESGAGKLGGSSVGQAPPDGIEYSQVGRIYVETSSGRA